MVEALYGIMRADCVLVPINALNAVEENELILQQTGCSALFFHSKFESAARRFQDRLTSVEHYVCLDASTQIAPSLAEWMALSGSRVPRSNAPSSDVWAIYSTSGTTGRPKGVVHSHRNIVTAIGDLLQCLEIQVPPIHLVVTPLTHMAGVMMYALTAVGATHVLLQSTVPADVVAAIVERSVEVIFLPPTLLYLILALDGVGKRSYPSLRRFVYAGAPMAPEKVRQAVAVFGPVLTNIYAQTELLAPVTCLRPDEHRPGESAVWDRRLASIGRPTFSRIAGIMADDGTLLPPESVGELVIRSDCTMLEYLDDAEATAAVSQYGWHHTGDIGFMDEGGYITLVDRKKDMIVSGGFNIFSAEVERVLLAHPSVQEAAVIGVPDEKWGEAVKAVVELKPGESTDANALIAFCKDHLGSVKSPKSIEFWPTLPRSPTGKVLKKDIRGQFWQGHWRQI
jgi:acyl-CoA synthetase (AMP-forming)/AMP-acid ligase II